MWLPFIFVWSDPHLGTFEFSIFISLKLLCAEVLRLVQVECRTSLFKCRLWLGYPRTFTDKFCQQDLVILPWKCPIPCIPQHETTTSTKLCCSDEINKVMISAWFPPHVMSGLNLGLIRTYLVAVMCLLLSSGFHMATLPWSSNWLQSCSDGCPSSRFFHLYTVPLEFCS